MKKITLITFLTVFAGSLKRTLKTLKRSPDFSGFEGLGGECLGNPSVDSNNGSDNVGELIVVQSGNPWQGANLVMQQNYRRINPVNNTDCTSIFNDCFYLFYNHRRSVRSCRFCC